MSLWRADPERAADALLLESFDRLVLPPPVSGRLLAVDVGPDAATALFRTHARAGTRVARRLARAGPLLPGWLPDGEAPFQAGILRLPKDKDEIEFAAHLALGALDPAAPLYLYGGNDEGIRSVAKRFLAEGMPVETLAAHSHGRVLRVLAPRDASRLRPDPFAWRRTSVIDFGDGRVRPWTSYPGVFNRGRLDAGTALLLRHLPQPRPAASILDFGCGTGILARALLDREPTVRATLLDHDHWALVAAAANVPEATTVRAADLAGSAVGAFDLIVSNPPLHDGIRETHDVLHALIAAAPARLRPGGRLVMVVQRRIPLERSLLAAFKTVDTLADDGRYRIWSATR